jgi:hypothetical protein|eukprot:COSAG06_NODE_234_length_19567_cov_23.768595_17_plen_121_part_00
MRNAVVIVLCSLATAGAQSDGCRYAGDVGCCTFALPCVLARAERAINSLAFLHRPSHRCSRLTTDHVRTDAHQGECDVPTYCSAGTDVADCDGCRYANDVSRCHGVLCCDASLLGFWFRV